MAGITIRDVQKFPTGTSVPAYPESAFPQTWWENAPQAPPAAAVATETQVVDANGNLTYVALANNTAYVALQTVSGTYRMTRFRTAKIRNRQMIAPQPCFGFTATAALVNRRYSARFVADDDMLAAGIAYEVTVVATADDPVDVGLFDVTGAVLLASSGATLGKMNATTGIKYVPFLVPFRLVAGTAYYAALSYGAVGGTAATLRVSSSGAVIDDLFGTAVGQKAQGVQTSAHPLVAPLTMTVNANSPILAIREA